MRLLVHIAGEADLLLSSADTRDVRAAQFSARCGRLDEVLAGPAGVAAARDLLRGEGEWEVPPDAPGPSPLLKALDILDPEPDLDVAVIGTRQEPPDRMDSAPLAETLVRALQPGPTDDIPVRHRAEVVVPGLHERSVVDAFTPHLAGRHYKEALVTWGSGATALAMGVLTVLSQAGIPWRLLLTNGPAAYQLKDPLEPLDTDPVVNLLVRWRMFGALNDLATQDAPELELTPAQRRLVGRAAARHRAGFTARDCASLRAVVADAVVRRDGTANLAVRRYITRRYEELLTTDRETNPEAVDLLQKYENLNGVGRKLGVIRESDDPDVRASEHLPSYQSLFAPEVAPLIKIGNGSHTLRQPDPVACRAVGEYLSQYETDGPGWQDAGLPEPPVAPADTVLAVWLAGVNADRAPGTVGTQLTSHGPPEMVREHTGTAEPRIRAVIFGVPGESGSLDHAEADAGRMRAAGHEACAEPVELADADPAAVERTIASRLTRDVTSLLLVPTGSKQVILPLLDVMRRLGARHGVPLFVRETAKPATVNSYDVHQWPALTGGDRPLLIAAQRALRRLELDVAWRLLAASAIGRDVTDEARRLADTFASRAPEQAVRRSGPGPAPAGGPHNRTTGMVNQRLALVDSALTDDEGDAIRLLVLAADVTEASISATQTDGQPGGKYREYRSRWCDIARRHDTPQARPAQILLLLNKARDRAPVTHGTHPDPVRVVAEAAKGLREKLPLPLPGAWPADVPSLLRDAVVAAGELGLGQPDLADGLVTWHRWISEQITEALRRRT